MLNLVKPTTETERKLARILEEISKEKCCKKRKKKIGRIAKYLRHHFKANGKIKEIVLPVSLKNTEISNILRRLRIEIKFSSLL